MSDRIPDGADLAAYMARQDLTGTDLNPVMAAVVDWMGAHLQVDPWTAVHTAAALAAGAVAVAARAATGGVQSADWGPIFLTDRDVNIRRCWQLYAVGGFA